MNKNFLIHGTQEKYIENICNNGLENLNSSLFNLKSKGNLNFTIIMTIYHSIGIINQDKILNENYESITNFYYNNYDIIPNIIIFKNEIDNIINGERYQNNFNRDILSYP